jgi:2-polyprenyl-3-methyl-5-hydroxy-6-metoxy-1,4-benzoquinol methylase
LSDYVLEHVEHPMQLFTEVCRVLRPGGNYFFRTPNIYHYVTLISLITPHWLHVLIANRVRRLGPDAHEPWPTWYRINSRNAIRNLAQASGFTTVELRMVEAEPSYLQFAALPFLLGTAYERAVNSTDALAGFRANIFGKLVK